MPCAFVRVISYVVNIIRHAKSSMIPSFIEFYLKKKKKGKEGRKKKFLKCTPPPDNQD